MTSIALAATIAAMAAAFFSGGILLKEFSVSENIVHLVMAFCAYGLGNCLFLMVIAESGIARAMTLSSVLQIALTSLVAVVYYREALTMTQGLGVVCACAAAVMVMAPSSN